MVQQRTWDSEASLFPGVGASGCRRAQAEDGPKFVHLEAEEKLNPSLLTSILFPLASGHKRLSKSFMRPRLGLGRVSAWACPRLTREAALGSVCSRGEGRFHAGNPFPGHERGDHLRSGPGSQGLRKARGGGRLAAPHVCHQSSVRGLSRSFGSPCLGERFLTLPPWP